MTPFTAAVQRHVEANAPALAAGVLDYGRLLETGLPAIDFYDSRRHRAEITGSELAQRVRVRAGVLAGAGLGLRDRVVLVAGNDEQYLSTLLATLLLGALPCAVAPPPAPSRPDSAGVRHLSAAVRAVDPAMVLCPASTAAAVAHPGLVRFEDLDAGPPGRVPDPPPPSPDDPHHLQLTSGSTSAPKVVLLSHRNVADNLSLLAHGMRVERGVDRMFSWLPMYHDMGLIQLLGALLYGLPLAMMTPLGFLRDPLSWPRHMSAHRSTVTAGPTFAYRAAAEALDRSADPASPIDLTALRHAFVGAEPISHAVLRRFTESFAPLGLRPDALVPCYGMAESVLATTLALGPAPAGPGNFGRVRVLHAGGVRAPLVSCGPPVAGMRVSVRSSDGTEAAPGEVGDIWISGASVMAGYRQSDGPLAVPADGWHDTGDRGLLCDGELFVVGRRKEMLIVRGRNLPPNDVEDVIAELPGVGYGQAVVFAAPDRDGGRERVVAVVATNDAGPRVRAEVTTRVREVFGISLDDVVVVPRRAIPRTTSGKIQRLKVRQRYAAGTGRGEGAYAARRSGGNSRPAAADKSTMPAPHQRDGAPR